MRTRLLTFGFALIVAGCGNSTQGTTTNPTKPTPLDPDTAPIVSVDRFSDAFAMLFKRSANPALPAANAPIDFDSGAPYITHGYSPTGGNITYYNFDVLPATPAPIYELYRAGASTPLDGQLNVIGVIPGDAGYNDFWRVVKVTVPADYVPNTLTSVEAIMKSGYALEQTSTIVNCPVVPDGSTARLRYASTESPGLTRGWYHDKVVKYFTFLERDLTATSSGSVPIADIYVSFVKNPDPNDSTSGPASGFLTEAGNMQTHNVVDSLPGDAAYSPLWLVKVFDNQQFGSVSDLTTAMAAPLVAPSAALVNCPVVAKQ